jgi:hypothetical protein
MKEGPRERVTLKLPGGAIGIRNATCPNGCDLMDPEVKIHDLPSIKVRYTLEGEEGVAHLDPLYGRFESVHDWDPALGSIVEFACPHCGISLRSEDETCQTCSAPLFAIQLKSGIVEGCLRRGCLYHKMTIVDSDALMTRLFDENQLDNYL